MNSLVLDSSSIISISEKCFIKSFAGLSRKAELVIPKKVEFETTVKPIGIREFELNALRIKMALKEKWLKSTQLTPEFLQLAVKIKDTANNCFLLDQKPLVLIQDGEAETLALMKQINASMLVIDERNTRMLVEDIQGLKAYLERKVGRQVKINEKSALGLSQLLSGIKVCRSVELIAFAFEQGFLDEELENTRESLEAALYAVKFSGCAVSEQEIQEFLRGV